MSRGPAAPAGVGLYESFRWGPGPPPRLDLHAARLATGAERLGWPRPPQGWLRTQVAPRVSTTVLQRVRVDVDLQVDGAGGKALHAVVSSSPLPPAQPPLALVTGPRLRDAAAPLAGIKHTATARVDAALASARDDGADDVLLLDAAGRVSEASTSALLWGAEREAGWWTPSASCGPLASVTVAALSQAHSGCVRPAEVTVEELRDGARWMVLLNAIRGARAVGSLDGAPLLPPPEAIFTLVQQVITPTPR